MPQYCFTPANPDITGIGVRSASYIAFFITVISTAYCATVFPRPPESFRGLGRVRLYTSVSIMLASIVQAEQGQLSLFHTVAAAHLGQLNFVSSAAEMIFNSDPNAGVKLTPNEGLFFLQMLLNFFYTMFVALFTHNNHCALVGSDQNGFDSLHWVLFFGVHVHGALVTHSPLASFYGFLIGWCVVAAIYAFTAERKGRDLNQKETWVIKWTFIGALLLFGISEIVSIERSLIINTSLDDSSENQWGFGQVTAVVLLLAFIDPIIEIIFSSPEKETHTPPLTSVVVASTEAPAAPVVDSPLTPPETKELGSIALIAASSNVSCSSLSGNTPQTLPANEQSIITTPATVDSPATPSHDQTPIDIEQVPR